MSEDVQVGDQDEELPFLDDLDRTIYQWQMWADGVGELGQRKLKNARVLISRVGGVGGVVAYELAAAGVGKLVLAHGGTIKHSDLNRQLLMTYDRQRLLQLNPRIQVDVVDANINDENVDALVSQVDIVVDCAPIFEERYAMNRAIVAQGKPMVECAMFELEGSITTILPRRSPCLACLSPKSPPAWRRQFPVFGAVSGTVGCLAAVEVIKLITGIGESLAGTLLVMDLASMTFSRRKIHQDMECPICSV